MDVAFKGSPEKWGKRAKRVPWGCGGWGRKRKKEERREKKAQTLKKREQVEKRITTAWRKRDELGNALRDGNLSESGGGTMVDPRRGREKLNKSRRRLQTDRNH